MAKNLIIGAFTGYNYNQLKPWVESIRETSFNSDIVLIVGATDQTTVDILQSKGVILLPMPQLDNVPIHVARFIAIYEFLRNNKDYQFVVTTDVKDVYFQLDPIKYVERMYENTYDLVVGSEGILYKDEPWGNENLLQTYGPYIHELNKNNKIYNVGVIGGEAEHVRDLTFNIFTNAINRPIPIVDQAVFNVLIKTLPYKNSIYFAEQKDGWACHAGTTADPSKLEQFRPLLTEKEPKFVDGIVKTYDDAVFHIVHQYDRVPEWNNFIRTKYGQV